MTTQSVHDYLRGISYVRLDVWFVVGSESSLYSASWLGMDLATLLWSSG